MNTELYDAILADINSAYQEWEEGRAASPSADDLVAIALDHRPAPEHAPSPSQMAGLIYDMQVDGASNEDVARRLAEW